MTPVRVERVRPGVIRVAMDIRIITTPLIFLANFLAWFVFGVVVATLLGCHLGLPIP